MTQAYIIDGKAIAAKVRADVAAEVARIKAQHGFAPGLAVVLVGEDPASKVYVRNKAEQTVEVGMQSFEHKLPAETTRGGRCSLSSRKLNADPAVHGILVQLPLPKHIDSVKVLDSIDPAKDVDGFHPVNVGKLSIGERALVPCTPVGSIILAKSVKHDLSGLDAVVVGRSNIVGKPMAQLLLRENCTVTIAHSRTRDLPASCRRADIVVAAVGKPGDGEGRLDQARRHRHRRRHQPRPSSRTARASSSATWPLPRLPKVAGAITPVPGGVGPMTIACLLEEHGTALRCGGRQMQACG